MSQPLWRPRHCAKNLGAKVIKNRYSLTSCMMSHLYDGCPSLLCCSLHIPCLTSACFTSALLTLTDLPSYLPQAPASDCSYQRSSEGHVLLLISLVNNSPPDGQSPPQLLTSPSPLRAKTGHPVSCHRNLHKCATPGLCLEVWATCIKGPLISLLLTLGPLFRLEVGANTLVGT